MERAEVERAFSLCTLKLLLCGHAIKLMGNGFRTEKRKMASLNKWFNHGVPWSPRIDSFIRGLERFMEQTSINSKLPQGLKGTHTFRGSKPLDTSVRRQHWSWHLCSVNYILKQNGPEKPAGQPELWRKEGTQNGCDTINSIL